MAFRVINPATGAPGTEYSATPPTEVRAAVAEADRNFSNWRRRPFAHRAAVMRQAAGLLDERTGKLAELMAVEMGKPVTQGRAEVAKCAAVCRYYADHGEGFLVDEAIPTESAHSFVTCQPLGVILAVMPWNFPFWQVFRAAVPALMAGNTMLLKHASNVPGSALAIEAIWRDAGLDDGCFRTLLIDSSQVRGLIRKRAVRAVTFTGSTTAGRLVAREAGSRIKKTVLELGGSDPYIVLADADLELAADLCARSRLINAGQSCIAAKRFIVVEKVQEEFEALFVRRMAAATTGDPMDDRTMVGPLARADLRDELHRQVVGSVRRGARLVLGGAIPDGAGFHYPPTVISDVKRGMPAWSEELFGPAAAIIPVRDTAAAIRAANSSVYGLGAAVFTRDIERGMRMAREELVAGTAVVNDFVRSDPRLPFGGVGESGFGRELGREGIREFVNIKTVVVA